MLYGPDGALVVADDPRAEAVAAPCAVAADAAANGFVPIDAASAPAPIAFVFDGDSFTPCAEGSSSPDRRARPPQ